LNREDAKVAKKRRRRNRRGTEKREFDLRRNKVERAS